MSLLPAMARGYHRNARHEKSQFLAFAIIQLAAAYCKVGTLVSTWCPPERH
jgi:hypothetical protein